MDQNLQSGNTNTPDLYPMKRKRGRPRKDPSLKRPAVSRAPVGYGMRDNKYLQAETIDFSNGMLGQPVNGVIESSFDAGYLLNVRIGNSSSNYRGLVFKPGNFLPITASNDVAPHAQMIKRNEIPFPLDNQSQSSNLQRDQRFEINGLRSMVPPPPSSFTHLNGRGVVVPVVLQPVTAFNGSSPSDSSDKDVVAAEPLSVLLPFGSQSSNQFMTPKTDQLSLRGGVVQQPRSFQNANDSCSEERAEVESSTHIDVPVTVKQGPYHSQNDTGGSSALFSQMGMSQGTKNISFSQGTQHR